MVTRETLIVITLMMFWTDKQICWTCPTVQNKDVILVLLKKRYWSVTTSTSSTLTKIGIIYTQVLQEEKIFLMIPRSEWPAQWSLKYAWKCSEMWVKNSQQNFLLLHGKHCPSRWCFLGNFWTGSKPSRRSITAAKRYEMAGENGKAKKKKKKIKKTEKPKHVGHFLIQDFCACPSRNVVKRDASGKKGMLSCCKCLFD